MIFVLLILLIGTSYAAYSQNLITNLSPSYLKTTSTYRDQLPYIDRTIKITSIPKELEGANLIRTKMDDKNKYSTYKFTLTKPSTVYVIGWDDSWSRGRTPSWINNFQKTDLSLSTTMQDTSLIYKKDFPAGQVSLGSCGSGCYGNIMYFIIVKEKNTEEPPTCTPTSEICSDKIDNDCDGLVDCSDLSCSTSSSCIIIPPTCTEKWSCSSWSACSNNLQTRTCTDLNKCGTTENKPGASQSCSNSGLIFSSSWDSATGTSSEAINDGGKWTSGYGPSGIKQQPYVSSGGPEGHNFLNMVSVGDGGWGNPYYMNWFINQQDAFKDPNDLYIGFYFRVHQSWVNNIHNSNHWFQGIDSQSNHDTKHYFRLERKPGESAFNNINSQWVIGTGINAWDEVFKAAINMNAEEWYYFEVHVHKVDATHERWYFKLNGVDITDKYMSVGGPHYGKWLDDLYMQDLSWQNEYHGNLWMAIYDEITLNQGWDISMLEVRNDTWPSDYKGL